MKAIMTFLDRVDGQLLGGNKVIMSSTKKDARITAKSLATQMDVRLMDIIFDDNPYWTDYIKNIEAGGK